MGDKCLVTGVMTMAMALALTLISFLPPSVLPPPVSPLLCQLCLSSPQGLLPTLAFEAMSAPKPTADHEVKPRQQQPLRGAICVARPSQHLNQVRSTRWRVHPNIAQAPESQSVVSKSKTLSSLSGDA